MKATRTSCNRVRAITSPWNNSRNRTTIRRNALALISMVAAGLLNLPLHAAPVSWDNGGDQSSWGNSQGGANLNWDGNLTPSTGDAVTIGPGLYTVNYNTALYATGGTELQELNVNGSNTPSSNDPTLNISQSMAVGTSASALIPLEISEGAIINHSAGTLTLRGTNADSIRLNATGAPGDNTTYNLSGTAALDMDGGLDIVGVNGATATFNMSGGSFISSENANSIDFNGLTTGNKLFNYTGGSINVTGSILVAGTTSEFRFDGGGTGLSVTFGTSLNKNFTVGGTLSVIGDTTIDSLITTVNADLTLQATSTYAVTINATGNKFLQITTLDNNAGENFVLQGGTLTVTYLGGYGTFDILVANGPSVITGDFAIFNLPANVSILDNGNIDGTYTLFVPEPPIPEPASATLLGGALALLASRTRRRRVGHTVVASAA